MARAHGYLPGSSADAHGRKDPGDGWGAESCVATVLWGDFRAADHGGEDCPLIGGTQSGGRSVKGGVKVDHHGGAKTDHFGMVQGLVCWIGRGGWSGGLRFCRYPAGRHRLWVTKSTYAAVRDGKVLAQSLAMRQLAVLFHPEAAVPSTERGCRCRAAKNAAPTQDNRCTLATTGRP